MPDTKTKRPTVRVTIAKFDHMGGLRYTNARDAVKIGEFEALTGADYNPNGGTPLRDATMTFITSLEAEQDGGRVVVGLLLDESGSMAGNRDSVIMSANKFVQDMAAVKKVDRASGGKVLAVILTDGFENSSKEVTTQMLQTKIAEKEAAGWTFIYLGANQDAWKVGASTGFSGAATGQSVNYTSSPSGTRSAMADVSSNAVDYLSDNAVYMAAAAGSSLRTVAEDGEVTAKDKLWVPAPDAKPVEGTSDAGDQAASLISES